jgi:hypothetical protein
VLPTDPNEGVAVVEVDDEMKVDEKGPAGKKGATITLQGLKPASVKIALQWTTRIHTQMRAAIREVWPTDGPLDIVHPNAEDKKVSAVQLTKCSTIRHEGGGLWSVTLEGIGWAIDTAKCGLLLMVGSKGAEVSRWQTFLTEQSYDPGPIDGIFGPLTKAGTQAFQTAQSITADGIVGPITFGKAAALGYAQPAPTNCSSATTTPKASQEASFNPFGDNFNPFQAGADALAAAADAAGEYLSSFDLFSDPGEP